MMLLYCLKPAIFRLLLLIVVTTVLTPGARAQLDTVLQASVDGGAKIVAPYIAPKINDTVRLVGLGELQPQLGGKECIRLNTAIAAYLIREKGFNVYAVDVADWLVRDFNGYMLVEDKALFSQDEFDSLFSKAFKGSRYFNDDFKRFAIWLKKYNSSQNKNKVKIKGVRFLIETTHSFPEMNHQFIENYIRPFSNKTADSIGAVWVKNGNSTSIPSEKIINASMQAWSKMANDGHIIANKELFDQMQFDITQRAAVISCFEFKTNIDVERNSLITTLFALYETVSIDSLMRNKSIKIIYSASNPSLSNASLHVYNKAKGGNLSMPTSGPEFRKRYNGAYVNTVATFSDSASVIGTKGSKIFEPIVLVGDLLTKKLATKKQVYYLPQDAAALSNFRVPVINAGAWGPNTTMGVEKEGTARAFDILFIFRTITKGNAPETRTVFQTN